MTRPLAPTEWTLYPANEASELAGLEAWGDGRYVLDLPDLQALTWEGQALTLPDGRVVIVTRRPCGLECACAGTFRVLPLRVLPREGTTLWDVVEVVEGADLDVATLPTRAEALAFIAASACFGRAVVDGWKFTDQG